MKLHEKLLKLRKEHNYSQEQLADLLNVSRQTISKWENGTITPTTERLQELCKIYEISLSELLGEAETAEAFPITPQPPKKSGFLAKIDKRIWIGGGILAFALLIGLIMLIAAQSFMLQRQISKMQSRINWLESSLVEIQNKVEYTYTPNFQPSSIDSMLSSFDTQFIKKDIPGNSLVYRLSATPKEFHENDIGEFILDNGTESQTISAELKDGIYQADFIFPRDMKLATLFFKIANGENFQTESLGTTDVLFGTTQTQYEITKIPSCKVRPGLSTGSFSGRLECEIYPAFDPKGVLLQYPTSALLRIRQNDTVVKEIPMDIKEIIDAIKSVDRDDSSLYSLSFSRDTENISFKVKHSSIPVNCDLVFTDNWNIETVIPVF